MTDKQLRTFFLIATLSTIYLMRISSAMQDGLSDRAVIDGMMVGWWPWHILGWIARDYVQLGLLVFAGLALGITEFKQRVHPFLFVRKVMPRLAKFSIDAQPIIWLAWLGVHALVNYGLHNLIYWWAVANRHLFLW